MAQTLIRSNGSSSPCPPKNGKSYTLEELQKLVGGYIEVVRIPSKPNLRLVVNEEGLLMGLPPNFNASALAEQPLVGDAVLIHDKDLK